MFCPKCATQNVDGASFCRSCGANVSLIPQALTGQLPETDEPKWPDRYDRYSRKRRNRQPSIEEAIRRITMGVAFTIIAVMVSRYAPSGNVWWFWMLIPAFGCFGKGFAELARFKTAQRQSQTPDQPQLNTVRPADLPAPKTGELRPPVPSVTEGTTRHLGVDPQTRRFEHSETQKPS
jgi:zinc ribbon protein